MRWNQKKTKPLSIDTSSKNKTKSLEFECLKDPMKFLGTYLSHEEAGNDKNNFYIKIRKTEAELSIWPSRDQTEEPALPCEISWFIPVNLHYIETVIL